MYIPVMFIAFVIAPTWSKQCKDGPTSQLDLKVRGENGVYLVIGTSAKDTTCYREFCYAERPDTRWEYLCSIDNGTTDPVFLKNIREDKIRTGVYLATVNGADIEIRTLVCPNRLPCHCVYSCSDDKKNAQKIEWVYCAGQYKKYITETNKIIKRLRDSGLKLDSYYDNVFTKECE